LAPDKRQLHLVSPVLVQCPYESIFARRFCSCDPVWLGATSPDVRVREVYRQSLGASRRQLPGVSSQTTDYFHLASNRLYAYNAPRQTSSLYGFHSSGVSF